MEREIVQTGQNINNVKFVAWESLGKIKGQTSDTGRDDDGKEKSVVNVREERGRE